MTTKQIYADINNLITLLKEGGHHKLAAILEHRMYKVSWTSSTELLENVATTLEEFIGEHEDISDKLLVNMKREIVKAIKSTSSQARRAQ